MEIGKPDESGFATFLQSVHDIAKPGAFFGGVEIISRPMNEIDIDVFAVQCDQAVFQLFAIAFEGQLGVGPDF